MNANKKEKNQSTKIGLVLSGGGIRGVAHLGAIKALEEHGVTFSVISGTSAGAIVGALYASGHSINEILKMVLGINTFKLMRPALSWKGILNMNAVEVFLEKYLPDDSFEKLDIPLYITATNLKTGKPESFHKGLLRKVICASSCIPVLFDPVEHEGKLYIDGGILNNLPVQPIKDQCDFIIGVHCNPIGNDYDAKNARGVMERALMLAITQNVYMERILCDLFIEPKGLEPFRVLDVNKAQEIYSIGYEQTIKQIETEGIVEKLENGL